MKKSYREEFSCQKCGFKDHRDLNAARNIFQFGNYKTWLDFYTGENRDVSPDLWYTGCDDENDFSYLVSKGLA